MMSDVAKSQYLRGAITTASGDRIPMRLALHPIREVAGYSHAGQLDIPGPWLDEFAQSMNRFTFRSEEGEFFSQFLILEGQEDAGQGRRGRMILLRDAAASNVIAMPMHDPAETLSAAEQDASL